MNKLENIIKDIVKTSRRYDTVNISLFVDKILALDQPQEEIEEIALFDIAKHLYSNYAKTIEDKLNEVVREINKINNKIK